MSINIHTYTLNNDCVEAWLSGMGRVHASDFGFGRIPGNVTPKVLPPRTARGSQSIIWPKKKTVVHTLPQPQAHALMVVRMMIA